MLPVQLVMRCLRASYVIIPQEHCHVEFYFLGSNPDRASVCGRLASEGVVARHVHSPLPPPIRAYVPGVTSVVVKGTVYSLHENY